MLGHLKRILKNHYDTGSAMTPAECAQHAAEIEQQLGRHERLDRNVGNPDPARVWCPGCGEWLR